MPREVKQRKASRQAVDVNDSPRSLSVTASQNVVAPTSGFERLAGALGTLKPFLDKELKDYQDGERERLDLEGKQWGLDESVKMKEAYERTWKNGDNALGEIDAYFNESVAKLPDNQMKKAALSYMMRTRADLQGEHNTFVAKEEKLKVANSLGAVFDDTAINGGGLGKNGMNHFFEYGRTQGMNDRELGAIAMERALLHAKNTGNVSLLDGVESHVVDDVPLGTVYKEQSIQARTAATAIRNKEFSEDVIRQRSDLEIRVEQGIFGTPEDLAAAKRLGYSSTQATTLLTNSRKKAASGLGKSAIKAAYQATILDTIHEGVAQQNFFARAPEGKDKNDAVKELYAEAAAAGDVEGSIRIAKVTGHKNDTWANLLNNTAIAAPDSSDGTVPPDFLNRYELYKMLRSEPGVLNTHLEDQESKDFFYAYDVALETRDSPEAAYAAALKITHDPESTKYIQNIGRSNVTSAVNDMVGVFDTENDDGYLYAKLYKYAEHNIRKGASLERAMEDAKADFEGAHTKINDAWVYTGGRPVPDNIEQIREFVIEEDFFAALEERGEDTSDLDPEDYTIIPDIHGRKGIWQVIDNVSRTPTTTLFDMQPTQQRLSDKLNPRVTPADFTQAEPPSVLDGLPRSSVAGAGAAAHEVIGGSLSYVGELLSSGFDEYTNLIGGASAVGISTGKEGQEVRTSMLDGIREKYKALTDSIEKGAGAISSIYGAAGSAITNYRNEVRGNALVTKQAVTEELVAAGTPPQESKVFTDYLIDQEGAVRNAQGNHEVYKDQAGLPTIGYGHLIKKGESFTTLTEKQARELLQKDIEEHSQRAAKFVDKTAGTDGAFENLPKNLQAALIDMEFNPGLRKFPRFTQAILAGNLDEARRQSKRYTGGKPLTKRNRGILKFLS